MPIVTVQQGARHRAQARPGRPHHGRLRRRLQIRPRRPGLDPGGPDGSWAPRQAHRRQLSTAAAPEPGREETREENAVPDATLAPVPAPRRLAARRPRGSRAGSDA